MIYATFSKSTVCGVRATIVLFTTALLLVSCKPGAPSGTQKEVTEEPPNEVIEIFVDNKPLLVPADFARGLRDRKIAGLAVITTEQKLGAYTLAADSDALKPLDLCEAPSGQSGPYDQSVPSGQSGAETCKVELSAASLVTLASSSCYECLSPITGSTQMCHRTGSKAGKLKCEPSTKHGHSPCDCPVP